MGEDEDGLARTFACGLGQPGIQLLPEVGRIGIRAGGHHADGDEGIALDDLVLVKGVGLAAVEDAQPVLVVGHAAGIAVVVIAHHEEQVAHGIRVVRLVVEYAHQHLVLVGAPGIGQVAGDGQSIELAL